MNRRLLLLAGLALASLAPMRAEDAAVPQSVPVPTSTSNVFSQVTCTTNDAEACADTLQLAADTREALSPILGLGTTWRFAVNIHVLTADDPLTATIDREAVQVIAQGETMQLNAIVPIDDPDAREFIQRQYVTAMLWERFFATTKTFDDQTRLDVVPLWLVEGLREWVNEDPTHNREGIARRAVEKNTAPTLQEVTSWKKLSGERLYGLWQRAFSYYLVASMTREGARRDDFQQWLDSFSSPGGSGQLHFPTEANWQQELADAAARSHNVVFTWQETADALAANETLTYAESKDAKVQTCTLDQVMSQKRTPALLVAAQERADILTQLELRTHPSWRPILEAYRSGLATLIDDKDPDTARRLFAEAHALRQAEAASHQKQVDYLNWFEVTRDFGAPTSRFRGYFAVAKRVEQVVADPTHPNPIRASLLQVESRL